MLSRLSPRTHIHRSCTRAASLGSHLPCTGVEDMEGVPIWTSRDVDGLASAEYPDVEAPGPKTRKKKPRAPVRGDKADSELHDIRADADSELSVSKAAKKKRQSTSGCYFDISICKVSVLIFFVPLNHCNVGRSSGCSQVRLQRRRRGSAFVSSHPSYFGRRRSPLHRRPTVSMCEVCSFFWMLAVSKKITRHIVVNRIFLGHDGTASEGRAPTITRTPSNAFFPSSRRTACYPSPFLMCYKNAAFLSKIN